MFERRDFQVYKGVDLKEIYPKICGWWASRGFYVSQIGPYHIHGTSYYSRIGLRREFDLFINDVEGGVSFDLMFRAHITDEGLIGGGVATLLFWPVAVVGGAVSYNEHETDARNTMIAFWQYINHETNVQGMVEEPDSPHEEPEVLPEPETEPCEICGALLPTDWKACPYCGNPLG